MPLLAPEVKAPELSRLRKRVIIGATLLTGFLSTLDMTSEPYPWTTLWSVVATCIPTISSELQTADKEAWIGTAYLWSNVTFTPLYGKPSDLFGRRNAYLQALVLFTVGTALCGCAPDVPVARHRAGLTFAVFGAGMGLGGPIAVALTQAFGWRAAFYAQLPLAALAIIVVAAAVPGTAAVSATWATLRPVDFGGSLTLLLSILSRSGESVPLSQDPFGIALAVAFPVFFHAFVYVELRVAAKPVLPLSLLSRRTPLCVCIIAGVIAIVNFNMIYHLPSRGGSPPDQLGRHDRVPPIMALIVKRTFRYKWATVFGCTGPAVAMALLSHLSRSSSWAAEWLRESAPDRPLTIGVLPMGAGFSGLLTLTLGIRSRPVRRGLSELSGIRTGQALRLARDHRGAPQGLPKASKAIRLLPTDQQALAREAYGVALRNTFFGLAGAVGVLVTALMTPTAPRAPDQSTPKPRHGTTTPRPYGSATGSRPQAKVLNRCTVEVSAKIDPAFKNVDLAIRTAGGGKVWDGIGASGNILRPIQSH
ncbi:hypothetical protein EHS25_001708 [Saitozyma podzolica]|uniref:Major facilitator superfamily (MFS) profile domain-containing protein n=1 Tax=Saitozyma podzolica TaxID=1890683 RepID=A0A427YFC7_9TREE|nr:hypothetical protein EHS25_001708 [Saitozyma podzolica]